MQLYDIFYKDGTMDMDIPLPSKPDRDTLYAHNTNWDGHYCIPRRGRWVEPTTEEIRAILGV